MKKSRYMILVAIFIGLSAKQVSGFGLWRARMQTGLSVASNVEEKPTTVYEPEEYEEYSNSLSPKQERADVLSEGIEYNGKSPLWKKAVRYPAYLARKVLPKTKPGALVLLRCGQSEFNANQTFTGWKDPDLTEEGVRECEHAARLLLAEGYEPDIVYTSRLTRAIKSTWTLLEGLDALYTPVFKTYRLNQRCYGSLEGLSKKTAAQEFGLDVVNAWRNSLKARPPPVKETDPNYHGHDRRYSDIPSERIPKTESLLDCQERARPLWEYKIRQDIARGKTVLVVAHRDTLRGLAKVLDGIDDEDIRDVAIPNGVPFVYRFDYDMTPRKPAEGSLSQLHTSATYLEKPGLLQEALKKEKARRSSVAGVDEAHVSRRAATLEESLYRLRLEQSLVTEVGGDERDVSFTDDEGDVIKVSHSAPPIITEAEERWSDDPSEFEEYDFFSVDEKNNDVPINMVPLSESTEGKSSTQNDAVVVLIRHGRTPHNNLGLFTGWEDPPLAEDGVEDAKNAGRLLKKHGFEFDVVYTSWLTRAIQTAFYVIDELDSVWLPMVKSWRLNERHYGALTGKSKKMVANEYGEDQLKKWRRGYTIKPPPVSSYSPNYPGNDIRRAKHFNDLPLSVRETINRSIEQRSLSRHRKFPKSESLKDCMDRSIPFCTEKIQEEAVKKGKRVLITSHENAIRGILMHLCDIPEEAMNQLHLPNGLPLVYSVKGKCISLLDDGSGRDPMEVHDFGPAAKYLFKPCEITDDFYSEMDAKAATT
jgi:2,3-bisphosphoglycerate-dependent phosphoglycerate mutase